MIKFVNIFEFNFGRKLFFLLLFLFSQNLSIAQVNKNEVNVKAYLNADGKIVESHKRTAPNSTNSDNFSTKGNVNPYTGKLGWINSDNGNVETHYTANITLDTFELNENWLRDEIVRKKIENIMITEARKKYELSENMTYFSNENVEHNGEENNLYNYEVNEEILGELSLNENKVQLNNVDLNISNEVSISRIKETSKSNLNTEEQKSFKRDKYILPVVLILSLIILLLIRKA